MSHSVLYRVMNSADEPARLGEILKAVEIEALLLERAHEALDDAVTLGLPDVRRRDRHRQLLHLVDARIGEGDLAALMKRRSQARLIKGKNGIPRVIDVVFHRDSPLAPD
jgi:hypothetical protein